MREHIRGGRALLAVCMAISSPGRAQVIKRFSADQMRMLHAEMDANKDEFVSLDEGSKFVRDLRTVIMLRPAIAIMQNMDANKDSFLSLEEFKEDLALLKMGEGRKEDLVHKFASFDDNGDELLSTTEVLPLLSYMFRFGKLDTNTDGVLSMKEFKQIAASKLKNAPTDEMQKSDQEAKTIFAALDTDNDKRINAKEHYAYESGIYAGLSALEKLFELADTNVDGKLSADEMVASRNHPEFGNSAAFHHSYDWMTKIEQALTVEQVADQARRKAEL
uniref:EF-hand domain-containing protein n=1 Tax=Coccolithus braarudii TaxID=221442 RepID=A0A7S0Q2E6_9EUKA|mmetsp:Transcript_29756/g.64045  ORF Transcript_29756/g.64045 Transcript_29756/m.64045 type:complete len:276 (+) Transcript_29756:322-1149(+)